MADRDYTKIKTTKSIEIILKVNNSSKHSVFFCLFSISKHFINNIKIVIKVIIIKV